jgi:hypothetical protein
MKGKNVSSILSVAMFIFMNIVSETGSYIVFNGVAFSPENVQKKKKGQSLY